MSLPTQDRASYDHKRFLLQVSDYLTLEDSNKIVYFEDLPRELEDKAPWKVLAQLQVRGKSTPEELVRILRDANLPAAAKKVKELSTKCKKAAVTRKDSGPSSLKLEDSLELALRNCDVLLEQMRYLQLAAEKGKKTRVKEVVSEATQNLDIQVRRKLKYVSGFLNSGNSVADNEGHGVSATTCNDSPSPPSSPESSLSPACSASSHSPVHRVIIKDSELQKAAKQLKPASGIKGSGASPRMAPKNANRRAKAKHPPLQPQATGSQNKLAAVGSPTTNPAQVVDTSCEEEVIYALPGPPTSKPLSAKSDRQYYNLPPVITRADNDSTLLVTGSTKPVNATNKKPATSPKPSSKGNQAPKRDGSSLQIPDDTSTGDSGFSDSTAFLKETTPLSSPDDPAATARAEQVSECDSTYAPLIKSEVKGSEYYKTLQNKRDAVTDVLYDDNR